MHKPLDHRNYSEEANNPTVKYLLVTAPCVGTVVGTVKYNYGQVRSEHNPTVNYLLVTAPCIQTVKYKLWTGK